MSLTRPRAVLLDWDNTLVDSFPVIHAAFNDTLRAMGRVEWTFEETCLRVAHSMRDTFPELFGDRWREASEVFYARYAARHLDLVQPLPGAARLLDALGASGAYLGVVSNKNGEYLRREVAHLGWAAHFGRVVGAQDAAEDKPSPAPVLLALAGSGIEPGVEVWFVGDNPIDVACARAAGCRPVLVRGLTRTGGEAVAEIDCPLFASCDDLAAFVETL